MSGTALLSAPHLHKGSCETESRNFKRIEGRGFKTETLKSSSACFHNGLALPLWDLIGKAVLWAARQAEVAVPGWGGASEPQGCPLFFLFLEEAAAGSPS